MRHYCLLAGLGVWFYPVNVDRFGFDRVSVDLGVGVGWVNVVPVGVGFERVNVEGFGVVVVGGHSGEQ